MKLLFLLFLTWLACGPCLAQASQASPALELLARRVDEDEKKLSDWAELARYRNDNAHLPAPRPGESRVVFLGDSITDFWGRGVERGTFFPGKPYVNRGISTQTTAQMLVRFRADVAALKPRVVVILAGTNDIAGNTGPATDGMIEDNLASMSEIAQANGIKVVLSSLLPVNDLFYPNETESRPQQRIRAINNWLRDYAAVKGFAYLDYYGVFVDANGLMKPDLSNDGLHPNTRGYRLMESLAQQAIDQALRH
ncbi:SGNH/GDSL hydrolase family protein [Rudaea sp.]|uniref:SGNH/GDSL hydrolase family protein n=1 Tax=Rudaea sp. TaxID=2136325 RepID=UPI002ED3B578